MIVRCLGVILWTLVLVFVKLNSLRYATHLILQQSKVRPFNIQSPNLLGREGSIYLSLVQVTKSAGKLSLLAQEATFIGFYPKVVLAMTATVHA